MPNFEIKKTSNFMLLNKPIIVFLTLISKFIDYYTHISCSVRNEYSLSFCRSIIIEIL